MTTFLYYPPTQNGLQKSLGAQLDEGNTSSMTLNNITGVQNKPGVVLLGRIDAGGTEQPAATREFVVYTGTSGSTLTGLTRGIGGSTDQDHAIGTVVEFVSDITLIQGIIDFLLVEHNESTGTHKALTSPSFITSINDVNAKELFKITATTNAVNELTIKNNITGNNPALSASGDDTDVGFDIKMKGAGRFRKPTVVGIQVIDSATDCATGDGKAYFRVPAELNGMNLTGVAASVYTAGTTGTQDVQIRRVRSGTPADMLSTKITIDSTETDTSTAATAAVINGSNDDVNTGDLVCVDIDAVQTTKAKGLYVELRFELP